MKSIEESLLPVPSLTSVEQYEWPMKRKDRKPFDHQKATTIFLLFNKRAYCLNQMRTGKTLSILWANDILLRFKKIKKVLVVCTLINMRLVWAAEIFENFPWHRFAIAHGNREKRIAAIKSNVQFVIINHDGIKSVPDELIQENFDILVIDELTAFKTASSDRWKKMKRVADTFKAVWGMTGNATPNSPSEAFGQAHIVNPKNPFLPRYFTKFKAMVEQPHPFVPYMWEPKPEAKRIVHQVLQPAIRFERDQCMDIPPMTHEPVFLKMSAEQEKVYAAIKDQLYHEYEKGEITASNSAVKLGKLLQVAAGAVFNDDRGVLYLDDTPKMDYIIETLEEADCGKIVVVSAFRATVERVCQNLIDKKIKAKFVHGGVTVNRRFDIIREFQNADLQVLVVQPQAVSHGICLDATNIIVWHSIVASGETYGQMVDRIISASQKRKQINEYLLSCPADKHMFGIVTRKSDMSAAILDLFKNRDL